LNIFGICLVKDEADIIEHCLDEASKWASKIFIYDNGSDDHTWEIVKGLAKTNKVIVPYKQVTVPFRDELRAQVFNKYKDLAQHGDWWCFRMDADEFYIDDPRDFLVRVPKRYHVVAKESYDFRLTYEDVEEYKFTDQSKNDIKHLKYYNPLLYTEMRFFRHRSKLQWRTDRGFPTHMGILSTRFIKVKHYQHRSPNQIKKRLNKKRHATNQGYKYFRNHDNEQHWYQTLAYRRNLIEVNDEWRSKGYKYPNLYKKSALRHFFEMLMHYLKLYP